MTITAISDPRIIAPVGCGPDARAPALADFGRIAQAPIFLAGKRDAGHEGTFREPNGGAAAQVAVAWLKWQLRQDCEAGSWFIGEACGLCANPAWEVMRKGW